MAKGIWEQQLAENQLKFRRQLKIRVWAVFAMVLLDFLATFTTARLFVQGVADDSSLWWQVLWFSIALLTFSWLRRDSARLAVVARAAALVSRRGDASGA